VASYVIQAQRGVLDGVVQQCGADRRLLHAELGDDRRDRKRVRDVGVAAAAELATVVALCGLVGTLDDSWVGLGMVGAERLEQRLELGRRRGGAWAESGQPRPDARGS